MEYLSQQHYQLLLNKEWLVKIDSDKSTPYLLKFYSSSVNFDCCLLITDTRNVWGEGILLPVNTSDEHLRK